jgi:hypothetical protein
MDKRSIQNQRQQQFKCEGRATFEFFFCRSIPLHCTTIDVEGACTPKQPIIPGSPAHFYEYYLEV